jgi:hypothetical protein
MKVVTKLIFMTITLLVYPMALWADPAAPGSGGLAPYLSNPMLQLAALGAFVTYIFSPAADPKAVEFNRLVLDDLFAGGKTSLRAVVLLAIFVLVGALVAMIMGSPDSDRSAFMIGMGWTGLVVAGKGAAKKLTGGGA